MSAIRPLATIAVLAALGIFLALKINEQGPVALDDASLDGWEQTAPAFGEASSAEAPAFDASQATLSPRSAPTATQPTAIEPAELPDLPPLPELPRDGGSPAGPTPDAALAGEAPKAADDLPLPAEIPTARYGAPAEPQAAPAVSGRVPSLGSSTPDLSTTAPAPAASAYEASATTPITPQDVSQTVPIQPSGFDAAWPLIQSALARNELTRAHLLLSQWRNEPTLTDNQRADVNVLLDQLAGTVVYSLEHRLEPPHLVKQGETLKSIAQQYQAPWELLAKINGVARPDAIHPGQTLKVVRGPFNAEVSLATNELVLLLDGRYAGRFTVEAEGAATTEGQYRVEQKSMPSPAAPRVELSGPGGRIALDASPVATPEHSGRLRVAANQLGDVYDILSVGSTVTVTK